MHTRADATIQRAPRRNRTGCWCVALLLGLLLTGLPRSAHLAAQSTAITAVWANDGEDKVTQDEIRASSGQTVTSSLWNGSTITLFGLKNEVVNFNLVLEAASTSATNVAVTMSDLNGPGGSAIRYAPRSPSDLFNWTTTESELFYVRYLQILGLSYYAYGTLAPFQEPTFPQRAQCPSGTGCAWTTRSLANKYYPDIAVPIELVPNFNIAAGNNQSVWADIYIPRTATAGSYSGTVTISENGVVTHTVPISLTVRNAMLPDAPSSKTMLFTSYGDLNPRYGSATTTALQNQIMVAHRHKLSLIDDNFGQGWSGLQPASQWRPFLSGSGFTSSNGYAGPGVSTGQDVFSIGTYGGMTNNSGETQSAFTAQFNGWESWFEANAPSTERFVYLCDEVYCQNNTPTLATQLQWWQGITGAGHNLHTLATQSLSSAVGTVLGDPTSQWYFSSQTSSDDQTNVNTILASEPIRRLYVYNGGRPGGGSTIIEDEGTSVRELPWGQYKKQVDRSFIWETTYYNDYQRGRGNTNVFVTADTFGQTSADPMYGQVGGSNGNGVTFYPGTDGVFPAYSYGISGPIVSLRLKHWRRGIQDVDYLTLANAINPTAVTNLVNSMVPQALWENQCHDLSDCSYFIGPVSWSNKPDDWESARSQLADIIAPLTASQGYWHLDEGSGATATDSSGNGNTGTLSGTPLPTWTTGRVGNALLFGGSGGFANVPGSPSLNNLQSQGPGGMSVVAWIYPTSLNANQVFIDKGMWTFGFFTNGGILFSRVCASGQVQAYSPANAAPLNQWSQIVATWNGSTTGAGIVIYVNGVAVTANSQNCSGSVPDDSANALTLGATYYNGDPFFGKLDEVQVFNRVLSASEVSTLYTTQ